MLFQVSSSLELVWAGGWKLTFSYYQNGGWIQQKISSEIGAFFADSPYCAVPGRVLSLKSNMGGILEGKEEETLAH